MPGVSISAVNRALAVPLVRTSCFSTAASREESSGRTDGWVRPALSAAGPAPADAPWRRGQASGGDRGGNHHDDDGGERRRPPETRSGHRRHPLAPSPRSVGGRCTRHRPPTVCHVSRAHEPDTIDTPCRGTGDRRDQNGGLPGAGLSTTVAAAVAVVLVHPEPLVGILPLVTVSVFEPLYLPFTLSAFFGAAVIAQPESTLDLNVAPAFGMHQGHVSSTSPKATRYPKS